MIPEIFYPFCKCGGNLQVVGAICDKCLNFFPRKHNPTFKNLYMEELEVIIKANIYYYSDLDFMKDFSGSFKR